MTDLADYTWEFDGLLFGLGQAIACDGEGWDIGTDDIANQDSANIFTDAYSFGEDSKTPALWSWTGHTDLARYPDDAVEAVRQLGIKWNDRKYRTVAGAVMPLRYGLAYRTRVVFGRPRTFSQTMDNGIIVGNIPVQFEFQRADTLFYDDRVFTVGVPIDPQESTGLESPLTSPITTLSTIEGASATAYIGGDVATPFEATITGPVVNPRISGLGWELQLNMSIDDDESVTISTYPWGARATRNDGANVSGYFSAKSRLSKARLDPDGETLNFDGIDSTSTAQCHISWRPAYLTI